MSSCPSFVGALCDSQTTSFNSVPVTTTSTQSPLVVNPVQSLYEATAVFTTTTFWSSQTNTTTFTTPTLQPFCTFTINNYKNADGTASLQVAPANSLPPSACIGVYNLSLTVRSHMMQLNHQSLCLIRLFVVVCDCQAQDECSYQTDFLPLTVDCTRPVARIKCHSARADYNWQTMSFPALGFDGRDSYDGSGDHSGRVYAPIDSYAWTSVGPQFCGTDSAHHIAFMNSHALSSYSFLLCR